MTGDNLREKKVAELRELGWGRMFVREDPWPYEGEPWGFDNGAFVFWRHGLPFDGEEYERRIEAAYEVPERPYLAALPDIVGEGERSYEFSVKWYFRLQVDVAEWPWYLVLQDGMAPEMILPFLKVYRLHGLFLGGTNRFKAQAQAWCDFAHERGLRFHYGRAGTQRKVDHALRIGADSLDSCFPLWTKERWQRFVGQLTGSWQHPQREFVFS